MSSSTTSDSSLPEGCQLSAWARADETHPHLSDGKKYIVKPFTDAVFDSDDFWNTHIIYVSHECKKNKGVPRPPYPLRQAFSALMMIASFLDANKSEVTDYLLVRGVAIVTNDRKSLDRVGTERYVSGQIAAVKCRLKAARVKGVQQSEEDTSLLKELGIDGVVPPGFAIPEPVRQIFLQQWYEKWEEQQQHSESMKFPKRNMFAWPSKKRHEAVRLIPDPFSLEIGSTLATDKLDKFCRTLQAEIKDGYETGGKVEMNNGHMIEYGKEASSGFWAGFKKRWEGSEEGGPAPKKARTFPGDATVHSGKPLSPTELGVFVNACVNAHSGEEHQFLDAYFINLLQEESGMKEKTEGSHHGPGRGGEDALGKIEKMTCQPMHIDVHNLADNKDVVAGCMFLTEHNPTTITYDVFKVDKPSTFGKLRETVMQDATKEMMEFLDKMAKPGKITGEESLEKNPVAWLHSGGTVLSGGNPCRRLPFETAERFSIVYFDADSHPHCGVALENRARLSLFFLLKRKEKGGKE